jgi:transcriptional regulator GlxA family with amidase domain
VRNNPDRSSFDFPAKTNGAVKTNGAAKTNGNKHSVVINPETLSVQDGRLRKLLQMMETEPTKTIHDWAAALSLSHSYLRHLFKQATGFSFGHVLTEQRLQRAAGLLANSNLSVKEIASAVGYEHTSSFTRAFERRFEQAPRSYRHENGWK